MKRLWILCAFLGVPIAIVGLVLTIVITNETGYACETAEGAGTCTNDPKVLLGVAPLLIGLGVSGLGLWRWIVTSSKERASRPPGQGGGGLIGGLESWRQAQVDSVMARHNVPGAPGVADPPGNPAGAPAPPEGVSAGEGATFDASSWSGPFLVGLDEALKLGNITQDEYDQATRDAGL